MQINSTLVNNQQQKVPKSTPHLVKFGAVHGSSVDKKYICCICNRAFQYDFTYEAHFSAHVRTTSRPECTANSVATKEQTSVQLQGVPFENNKKYVCSVCGKAFEYEFSLKVHFDAHARTKASYRCAKSSAKGTTTSGRFTRSLSKRNVQNESYTCQICNQVFQYEVSYKVHLEGHVPRCVPNTGESEIEEHLETVLAPEQSLLLVNQEFTTPQSDGAFHGIKEIVVEPCAGLFYEDCQLKQEFGTKKKSPRKRPLTQATNSPTDDHLQSSGSGSHDQHSVISLDSPRNKQQRLESVVNCVEDDEKPFPCMFCDSAFRWEMSLTIHLKMHKEAPDVWPFSSQPV